MKRHRMDFEDLKEVKKKHSSDVYSNLSRNEHWKRDRDRSTLKNNKNEHRSLKKQSDTGSDSSSKSSTEISVKQRKERLRESNKKKRIVEHLKFNETSEDKRSANMVYTSTSRRTRSRSKSPKHDSHHTKQRHRVDSENLDETYKKYSSDRSSKPSQNEHRKKNRDQSPSKQKKSKKKSRKLSKKNSDTDSDSSSKSDSSTELLLKLHEERLRQKDEKKRLVEQLKANETPEEKRARRLREKQEKERRRRERMGWDGEYQCYTNQDNPFGDSALTQTFVWGKKLAKEGVKVVSRDQLETQNRQKQFENKIELEKVKRRRQEREAERAAREAEASAAQRAREAQQFDSWARQEDAFHLKQATLRTQIRIRDGRAKPIDLLAWYVSSEERVDALEMHEPYTYLNGLQSTDLEDLLEDIKVYMELEKDSNQSYWDDVTTIVRDELEKLRRLGAAGSSQDGEAASRRDGIHHAVAQDVTQVFKGKTGPQLEAMQQQIEAKISGRQDGVDIGYWESLLSQLKAHMARARLRDRHQRNLRRKLQLLKEEQGLEGGHAGSGLALGQPSTSQTKEEETAAAACNDNSPNDSETEQDADKVCEAMYVAGRYSPILIEFSAVEPGTVIVDEAEDQEMLNFLRARLHAATAAQHHKDSLLNIDSSSASINDSSEAAMMREARRGMAGDEASFSVEATLPAQPCLWSDKYRPRKPRYFNRVHTGFEWNKYNQTHYDMDNPPPKIVQGYKFNIFYPDLIDSNSTPHFSLKPCPDNPDFAILRFTAGPPYEDIAFKIVNREWEYSYKRGFRCHFHNNIFQLWFHFKRYRYRR